VSGLQGHTHTLSSHIPSSLLPSPHFRVRRCSIYTPFFMKKEVMQEVAQLSDFDEMLYKVRIVQYSVYIYMYTVYSRVMCGTCIVYMIVQA
jgi:hypothetical protein